MTDFKYSKVLVVIIILGLLAALAINWQRHGVEQSNSQVEVVMDYEDIVELAQIEGVPLPTLLGQFKSTGLTSLAVYETTLEKLNKSGTVTTLSGAALLQQYRSGAMSDVFWRSLVESGRIIPEDVYVIGQDATVFGEVKQDLTRRLSPERVQVVDGATKEVLAVKANYEKVIKWNLGLSAVEMQAVSEQGFYVIARPTNYTKVRTEDINAAFTRMEGNDKISGVMFVGEEVLGYPDLLKQTALKMTEKNLTLVLIENPVQLQFVKQEGLIDLAALNGFRAARAYVIPKDEQPKLKVEEAVHRWTLSDEERNIRVNLLRKYDKAETGKTLVETNLGYVAKVKQDLQENGFTLGRAAGYQPYFPDPFLLSVVLAGVTAAGVLFLTLVRPFAPRFQYMLFAVLTLMLVFPVLKGGGMLVRQGAALVSAIVFPALAMTWQLDRWRDKPPQGKSPLTRIMMDGIVGLVIVVLLAMAGGFYLGAVLADVRFFLEMDFYRGVKLTLVAPLILVMCTYLVRYSLFTTETSRDDAKGIWLELVRLLDYPVYIKTLLVLAAGAIVALVYIGRSGHTAGIPVPDIEVKLRSFLEHSTYARPREKEFMIGHPAFFLAVMAVRRNWPRGLHFILVIIATIGLVSMVETFAHLRTPVYMTFVRGIGGLLLGVVFGIIAVVGVQILQYLSFVLGRRPASHE